MTHLLGRGIAGVQWLLRETLARGPPYMRPPRGATVLRSLHPEIVPGDHVAFISSDDDAAKHVVSDILTSFGWPPERIIDLDPVATARGTASLPLLWLSTWTALGGSQLKWAICVGET
jgi:hypothetical protein